MGFLHVYVCMVEIPSVLVDIHCQESTLLHVFRLTNVLFSTYTVVHVYTYYTYTSHVLMCM